MEAAEVKRKRAEEELGCQKGLIASLLDSIPDIIFFKDVKGVYLGCNDEFARHVGRTKSEIAGRTDYDIYPKEEVDLFRENDRIGDFPIQNHVCPDGQ